MNKTKNIIWIISIVALVGLSFVLYTKISLNKTNAQKSPEQMFADDNDFESQNFFDGLQKPDSVVTYPLQDFEPGISEKYVYLIDINQDGQKDRITKTFYENWNAHSYYKYTVELKQDGKYVDVTPKNLQTTNGADCDLQQIQFKFKPRFQIVVISRGLGDTWDEPTMAHKKIFSLEQNTLQSSKEIKMRKVCDVKELF